MVKHPGELIERVTIKRPVTSHDDYGQEVTTWTDVATVWAKREALRGREYFAALQAQAETVVRFIVRRRADVDERMQLVWKGVPHQIISPPIDSGPRREWMELMCKASGVRDAHVPAPVPATALTIAAETPVLTERNTYIRDDDPAYMAPGSILTDPAGSQLTTPGGNVLNA